MTEKKVLKMDIHILHLIKNCWHSIIAHTFYATENKQ